MGTGPSKRMRVAALVALLMSSLALAGCIGGDDSQDSATGDPKELLDTLSEKLFEILPVEEQWITANDGKDLHHAVYRPDTEDPVPVFINFSPYWGDSAEVGGDNFAQYMINEYVPRGYAVVLASVRGTGHSEGCFQIGGDREVADMYDVVDFYANAEWSNGNIAAGGKSYDSTTQNGMIAKMPHPALKGIFHVSGITDMYRYNYVNGVPYASGAIFNTYYFGQTIHEYGIPAPLGTGSPGGASSFDEDADSLARLADDVACTELAPLQASGVGSAATGLKDAYWVERDWNRYIGSSDWNGSIFFVHGLQDWNVKPDHILPWTEALPESVRIRGWLHQDTENNGHVYPMRDDWNQTMLAWLDSELKGRNTGFWNAPAWDVQGTDMKWRQSATWPSQERITLEEGSTTPPGNIAVSVAVDNSITKTFDVANAGIQNATGAVRINGVINIEFEATPTIADPILTAVITLDGRWVGEAVLRGIYQDGLDTPTPIVPGQKMAFVLESYPLDLVVKDGQKLEVTLGAEPRFALANPASRTLVEYDGSSIKFNAGFASADSRTLQPLATPCFAC